MKSFHLYYFLKHLRMDIIKCLSINLILIHILKTNIAINLTSERFTCVEKRAIE